MRDSWVVSVGMRPAGSATVLHRLSDQHTQAGQSVDSINVHRAASADTLAAAPPEGQGGIDLVLYADQRIQHHRARLLQIQLVRLHLGLLGRLVGVPAVDMEGLHLRVLGGLRFLHGARLRLGYRFRSGVAFAAHLRNGVDGRIRASEDGWSEQRLGRCDQAGGRAERGHSGWRHGL